jgi:hypothetical protein
VIAPAPFGHSFHAAAGTGYAARPLLTTGTARLRGVNGPDSASGSGRVGDGRWMTARERLAELAAGPLCNAACSRIPNSASGSCRVGGGGWMTAQERLAELGPAPAASGMEDR